MVVVRVSVLPCIPCLHECHLYWHDHEIDLGFAGFWHLGCHHIELCCDVHVLVPFHWHVHHIQLVPASLHVIKQMAFHVDELLPRIDLLHMGCICHGDCWRFPLMGCACMKTLCEHAHIALAHDTFAWPFGLHCCDATNHDTHHGLSSWLPSPALHLPVLGSGVCLMACVCPSIFISLSPSYAFRHCIHNP